MKFINIGFSNLINADRVVGIVSPEAAPIKRIIQEAKKNNKLIDATSGRKTKSVVIMDSEHIVLSSIQLETINGRMSSEGKEGN